MSEKDDLELVEKIARDHQVIQNLTQSVLRRISSETTPKGLKALARDLSELRKQLECHFDLEEEAELVEVILERLPMVEPVLEDLKREHVDFLKKVDWLILCLESLHPQKIAAIYTEVEEFVNDLKEHEEMENGLLERAYNLDFGNAE